MTALASSKRSMMGINPKYATMSLQQLIKEGPPDGDTVEALGMARRKVLSEGIKSDSDGMVDLPRLLCAYVLRIEANAP